MPLFSSNSENSTFRLSRDQNQSEVVGFKWLSLLSWFSSSIAVFCKKRGKDRSIVCWGVAFFMVQRQGRKSQKKKFFKFFGDFSKFLQRLPYTNGKLRISAFQWYNLFFCTYFSSEAIAKSLEAIGPILRPRQPNPRSCANQKTRVLKIHNGRDGAARFSFSGYGRWSGRSSKSWKFAV